MRPLTILALAAGAVVSLALLIGLNPYSHAAFPLKEPLVLEEYGFPGHPVIREGAVLPEHACDTLVWLAYPDGSLRGERLLCGAWPPSMWRVRLERLNIPFRDDEVDVDERGWRVKPGRVEVPASSPRPFYVRIFWLLAFVALMLGIRRRTSLLAHREALGWGMVWGALSVLNRLQMLPGLKGLALLERRSAPPDKELLFHGPYWAVLLLEILVLWLALAWVLERLKRIQPALVQDYFLMFRKRPPRWVGGSVFLGVALAIFWSVPTVGFMRFLPQSVRMFPDPFLLAGSFPALHLLHRAFEMSFLLTGLWLVLLSFSILPRWTVWGFLVLLGAGPLFPPPLGWGALPFLYRLGIGGASALVFGLVLQRYGALVALSFALFAWMIPGSLFLLAQGPPLFYQVLLVWGLPLFLAGVWVLRGEPTVLEPRIPHLEEHELKEILSTLSARSFERFLEQKGWNHQPLWWKLALLAEEVYGVPVSMDVQRDRVIIRIPSIRMVSEGIRMVLGVKGREEEGWTVYRFSLSEEPHDG